MTQHRPGTDWPRLLAEPLAAVGLDLEAVDLPRPASGACCGWPSTGRRGQPGRRRRGHQEVSRVLDESDVMGEQPYTLEVASPGVDRPLTHPRHWRRNHDRLVEVRLADGTTVTGRIARATTTTPSTLDVDGEAQQVALARRRPRPGSRSSSTREGRRRPHGHRHEHPADAGAREGDLLRGAGRGDRAGPAHGVPQDARARPSRRGSSWTARPATSPCSPRETDEEGNLVAEYDDTPEGFGRIAATTAKQIMLQRLRDAEDELQVRRVLRQGGRHHLRGDPAGPRPQRRDGRPRQAARRCCRWASRCRARTTARHPDQVPGGQRPQGHARARR